jgi:hypothetical protein
MIIHYQNPNFDYLKDFHVTETLIQSFNSVMSTMPQDEGNTRLYLAQSGLQNIDDADVKNVLMSIQVLLGARDANATNLGDVNIRQAAAYYMAWINYYNYMCTVDYRFLAKPVIWNTRKRYDAYTIMQIERGSIMEIFIDNEFRKYGIDIGFYYSPDSQFLGESKIGIEIKHDMKSLKTGNYYIECGENHFYRINELTPSGILKSDNTIFWLIGTPNEYYIVRKSDLIQQYYLMNQRYFGWQNGKKFICCKNSRGFLIEKSKLQEIAVARSVGEFVSKYFIFQNYV